MTGRADGVHADRPDSPGDGIVIRRYRRSRRLRLILKRDGRALLTAPVRCPVREIERFLRDNRNWIELARKRLQNSGRGHAPGGPRAEYLKYRTEARRLIGMRVREYSRRYGFSFRNISIRNQTTRWGSCSGYGSLNFNYRLIFLPPELCDYVIVHEVCHLREMNHSRRFWDLVSREIPDWRERRARFRTDNLADSGLSGNPSGSKMHSIL